MLNASIHDHFAAYVCTHARLFLPLEFLILCLSLLVSTLQGTEGCACRIQPDVQWLQSGYLFQKTANSSVRAEIVAIPVSVLDGGIGLSCLLLYSLR